MEQAHSTQNRQHQPVLPPLYITNKECGSDTDWTLGLLSAVLQSRRIIREKWLSLCGPRSSSANERDERERSVGVIAQTSNKPRGNVAYSDIRLLWKNCLTRLHWFGALLVMKQ